MRTALLIVGLFSAAGMAQGLSDGNLSVRSGLFAENLKNEDKLTGVLSTDLFAGYQSNEAQDSAAIVETHSALKAGAFSLLVPGAGQLYNRNYIKAAAFFAVEVGAWVVNALYTQKANNQTAYFQTYADGTAADNYQNGHYNVQRYAEWIQANWQQLLTIGGHNPADNTDPAVQTVMKYEPILVNSAGGPAPWNRVDWYSLNQIESVLGGYFSHLLPPHGNQQYYELIGKYPQFRQGWDDSPYGKGNTNFTAFMDYATTNSGYYMDQRGKANSLFAVASSAIGVVLVNHFASAIEAAIWAHGHNKVVQANMSLSKDPLGLGYQTDLQLAVSF